MLSQIEMLRHTIRQFAVEFVQNPYVCYTEHGLHALFYTMLYNAIPSDQLYLSWNGYKVCAIQKEYPTAGALGKPKRQHWDIALIKAPPQSRVTGTTFPYDYFRLAAVVEFGMNEPEEHLLDDIERMCHPDANIEQGYVVHLYRLSRSGERLSGRDWPADSKRIISKERAIEIARQKPVEIVYGMYDSTNHYTNGVWQISGGAIKEITAEIAA